MPKEHRRADRVRPTRQHDDGGQQAATFPAQLSVQRDGPATLQPPSLLQQPNPADRYRLGGEYQLQLDPALLASMRQFIDQQLDPAQVRPALAQVNLAAPAPNAPAGAPASPTAASPAATPGAGQGATPGPAATPPAPAPAPAVPAGKGPDKPRPASPGDIAKAIMAVPAIDQAIGRLRTDATERVTRDWSRLNTGERAGVVTSLAVIGLGTIGGIASDPEAREFALAQLNGRPIPVPGLNWMHVELNTAGENVMVGFHVDVGRLLPPSLGFGPGSPNAIGGPPEAQPFVPGQREAAGTATDSLADSALATRILDAGHAGDALEPGVRRRLEPTLGASLANVRVHADAEADSLTRAVDAVAFTTGQDIFFRHGAYTPDSADGLRLIAHEATHTVQQASGPVSGTPTPSGVAVSDPADAFEQAATRTADRVMREDHAARQLPGGASREADDVSPSRASVGHDFSRVQVHSPVEKRPSAQPSIGPVTGGATPAVQRQTATKEKKGPTGHVGGESDSITFLPGPGTDTLAPGDAGYSRVLLAETGAAASKKSGLYADAHLRAEVPRLDTLDKQIKQRAKEKQLCLDEVSGWAGAGTNRRYRETADWCQGHLEKLESDRSSEEEKCASYNAWVPRANGFFTSLTRLDAMQTMLGVKDPEAMASALTKGLQDAKVVGERAQIGHAAGKAETLDVPAADETLTDLSNQTTQSAREMNTAWLGFQQNALAQRAADTNAEGAADRSRLQQINEVKAFVRNVGKTVDLTMSVVSGAPAAVATATGALQRGEASLNAYRNRRQIMAGERPTHNPTYVTVNEKGEMIVRNVQTGMDKPAGGGEATASPEMNIQLPKSVSDILGTITDFVYASEVKEINMRLEAIKSRCDAIEGASELLKIRERAQNFQDKLNAFALKCSQLQNRMAQRRTAYLQFGIQLDNFARKDAASRAAGQAPASGDERYATIMTVVSQVREVLAIGAGARDGFQSSRSFATWAQELNERRGQVPLHIFYDDGKYFPDVIKLPDSEWKPLERIYGQVKTFDENVGVLEGIFASVETQARALMGALNTGGGSVAY
jgi:hypothetical protein